MNERNVRLDELAQWLRPMSEGIEWFDDLVAEDQSDVRRAAREASPDRMGGG
ncbi:hypothetical protein ACIQMR_14335 [Streptomyces sp. NPDC091376]|uniref:hypothetical protein n=1 Tax=Streptomyces sp. NPDC091376 TaxID=3365994 RepID=UPI0037F78540